jgi:hypothetical protein
MKSKIMIFLAIILIALIVGGIQSVKKNMSGCSNDLLSRFKNLELAKVYQNEYLKQVNIPNYVETIDYYWEIEKQGDGCKIQFLVSYFFGKWHFISGDEFFINLRDQSVYPLSDGARQFVDDYGFDTKLP